MDGRTVRSANALNRPQMVVADWWKYKPPPFPHQPVPLLPHIAVYTHTHKHTHAHTHIHADCHSSAVLCVPALANRGGALYPNGPGGFYLRNDRNRAV